MFNSGWSANAERKKRKKRNKKIPSDNYQRHSTAEGSTPPKTPDHLNERSGIATPTRQLSDAVIFEDAARSLTPVSCMRGRRDSIDSHDSEGVQIGYRDFDNQSFAGFQGSRRSDDEKSRKSSKSALEKVKDDATAKLKGLANSFKGIFKRKEQDTTLQSITETKAEFIRSQEKIVHMMEEQHLKTEELGKKTDQLVRHMEKMSLKAAGQSFSPKTGPRAKKYQNKPTNHFFYILFHYVAAHFDHVWEKIVMHMLYECEAGKNNEEFVNHHLDILYKKKGKNIRKERLEEFLWQWESHLATESQKYDVINVLAETLEAAGVKEKDIAKFKSLEADTDSTTYGCLEDSYLHHLAGKFSLKEQKAVGFALDMTSAELDLIEQDNRGSVVEGNYQILLKWKRRNACYSDHFLRAKLTTCFADVGRHDIAQSLK